jgi:DNA-binding MarR family transcriptional regulator
MHPGKGALTMHVGTHNNQKETNPTTLELVLQLHGDFRKSLEPIRATPLQAGVMLYLRRCAGARQKDAATALRVKPPTLADVVQDLVRKRWVTKHDSVEDRRAVCLRLSRQGQAITRRIDDQVRQIEATLTEHSSAIAEHDGCALVG